MTPSWLIEKYIFDGEPFYNDLIDQLGSQNIEYKIFEHLLPKDDEKLVKLFPENSCVVSYGSFQLINKVKRLTSYIPGAYHTLKNYECSKYYPYLGKFLFNSPYIMLPVGELERMKSFLIQTLSLYSKKLFVRPNRGDKIWAGQLINANNFKESIDKISSYEVDPYEIAVVAAPKTIAREWRIVIVESKIVASSQYMPICAEGCPKDVFDIAEEILKAGFYPDVAWTMDICQDMKNDLYLLEIGGFSCAGLYHCSAKNIIEAVNEAALKEWKEYNEI